MASIMWWQPGCPCCEADLPCLTTDSAAVHWAPPSWWTASPVGWMWTWGIDTTLFPSSGSLFPSLTTGGAGSPVCFSSSDLISPSSISVLPEHLPASDYVALRLNSYHMLQGDKFRVGLTSDDQEEQIYAELTKYVHTVTWNVYRITAGGAPALIGGPVSLTIVPFSGSADGQCTSTLLIWDKDQSEWRFSFGLSVTSFVDSAIETTEVKADELVVVSDADLRRPIVGITDYVIRATAPLVQKCLGFDILHHPCTCDDLECYFKENCTDPYRAATSVFGKMPKHMTCEVAGIAAKDPYPSGGSFDVSLANKTHTLKPYTTATASAGGYGQCPSVYACQLVAAESTFKITGLVDGDGDYVFLSFTSSYNSTTDKTTFAVAVSFNGYRLAGPDAIVCSAVFKAEVAGNVNPHTISGMALTLDSGSCPTYTDGIDFS